LKVIEDDDDNDDNDNDADDDDDDDELGQEKASTGVSEYLLTIPPSS
jgi:hypothetical protein